MDCMRLLILPILITNFVGGRLTHNLILLFFDMSGIGNLFVCLRITYIFVVCQLSMSSVHFCVWVNLFLTGL